MIDLALATADRHGIQQGNGLVSVLQEPLNTLVYIRATPNQQINYAGTAYQNNYGCVKKICQKINHQPCSC